MGIVEIKHSSALSFWMASYNN